MSNKRNYEIVWNVTTNSVKLPQISVFNTDKNIFNFKLYIENGTGKNIVRATHDELAEYKVVLKTVKKKTNTYIEHDGVLDNIGDFFLFDLPEKFSNAIDSYNCQLFLTDDKNTTDITTDDEVVTSSPFTYTVKPSIITDLNGAIESNPDKPILEELIAEVKGLSGLDPDASETLLSPYEKKVDVPKKTIVEDGKIYLAKSDGTKIDSGTTLPLGIKREDLVVADNVVTMTNSDVQNITISADTTVTLPSNIINQELYLNVRCNTKDSILTFKNGNETTKLKLAANSYNVFQISANGSDYIIERKSTDYPELTEDEINAGISNEGIDLSNYQAKTDATLTTTSKTITGAINELDAQIDTIEQDFSSQIKDIATGLKLVAGSNNTLRLMLGDIELSVVTINGGSVEPPPATYTITNKLTNATSSNGTSSITEGSPYTTTITPSDGYIIDVIIVTMGGNNVTSEVVNENTITINNVIGNIEITVTAIQNTTSPLTNLIADIQPTDYYLDETDSLYKIYDRINDETITAYSEQPMLNPCRTFPGGNFTNDLTKIGTTFQGNTEGVSFMYEQPNGSAGNILKDAKLNEMVKFIVEFKDTWDNYTSQANGIPYINTSDTSTTYTSEPYYATHTEIKSSTGEWDRLIMTISLESNGEIKTYLNDELSNTIPAPSDFKNWDYAAMTDSWNKLALIGDTVKEHVDNNYQTTYMIRKGSTSIEDIQNYYTYKAAQSLSLESNVSTLNLEEGDNFFFNLA